MSGALAAGTLDLKAIEGRFAEASRHLQTIAHDMQVFATQSIPKLQSAEAKFKESLHQLRETNLKTLEEKSHELAVQLYQGIKWKADLAENLRRVKEAAKSDPNHPVNSKLRRALLAE